MKHQAMTVKRLWNKNNMPIKFEALGIQFSLPLRHSFWKQDDRQGPLDVNLLSDGAQQAAESNERS